MLERIIARLAALFGGAGGVAVGAYLLLLASPAPVDSLFGVVIGVLCAVAVFGVIRDWVQLKETRA